MKSLILLQSNSVGPILLKLVPGDFDYDELDRESMVSKSFFYHDIHNDIRTCWINDQCRSLVDQICDIDTNADQLSHIFDQ